MTRIFVVDDNDLKRISYSPSGWWPGGVAPQEYQATTHSTYADASDGASLTFLFNGTSIALYGTMDTGTASMAVDCRIDGASISVNKITAPDNQVLYKQLFCSGSASEDGEHTFQLTVPKPSDARQRFILDYIEYDTPEDSKFDAVPQLDSGGVVVVDDKDASHISYAGKWENRALSTEYDGTAHSTVLSGSRALFDFTGTKAAIYGSLNLSSTNQKWSASYQVDDGPVSKTDSSQWTSSVPLHQIMLYETPDLTDGNHTLALTYLSGPLDYTLDFFVYTPSPSSLQAPLDVSPSSKSSEGTGRGSEPQPVSGDSLSAGSKAGIAIGGVVTAGLVILVLTLVLKRRKRRQQQQQCEEKPVIFHQYEVPRGASQYSPAPTCDSWVTSVQPPPRPSKRQIIEAQSSGHDHLAAGSRSRSERTVEQEDPPPDYDEDGSTSFTTSGSRAPTRATP